MAIRNVFKEGEEVLRKKCREVTVFDDKLHTLIDDMWETMVDSDGVGLAAPQVGILRRVVVIDCGDNKMELINPTIIKMDGKQIGPEGCLSVDSSKSCSIERAMNVTFKAQDRYGKWYEKSVTELEARAVQHELDHLDGILFIDRRK